MDATVVKVFNLLFLHFAVAKFIKELRDETRVSRKRLEQEVKAIRRGSRATTP